ncbi:Uncharacterized protein Fot_14676 [Forsythia ovata]|uniref:Uncharacterized protein n=1 Tax=Forsythia ovata TaxID=205694 RepID=A0ABD1W700_9LAMI
MAEEREVAPRNVRGKAKLAFLGRTRVGKLSVSFRDGVAIGPNSTELSALAGRLGRDANLLPFHFLKWPLVDIEYKDRVMMEIKISNKIAMQIKELDGILACRWNVQDLTYSFLCTHDV